MTLTDNNDDTIETEYEPDTDKTVKERATARLEYGGEPLRAYEIAADIDSTSKYTRRQCNELHEEGEIEKEMEGNIVGHPMPPNGDISVLEGSVGVLRSIVNEHGTNGQHKKALNLHTVGELREFIKDNVAIGDGRPLSTQKVYFAPKEEDTEE